MRDTRVNETESDESSSAAVEDLSRRPSASALGAMLGGVLFSIALFVSLRSGEDQRARGAFERSSRERHVSIQSRLDGTAATLQSVVAFYRSSQSVNPREFRSFARTVMAARPEILAIEWYPRVESASRAQFEANMRAEGLEGFSIRERKDGGAFGPVSPRPYYLPLVHSETKPAVRRMVGLDLLTTELGAHAVQAQGTGVMTASGGYSYGATPADLRGFRIQAFSPLYREEAETTAREDRMGRALGCASLLLRLDEILQREAEALTRSGLHLRVYWDHPGVSAQTPNLVASAGAAITQGDPVAGVGGYSWEGPLEIGGLTLRVRVVATPAFGELPRYGLAWTLLGTSLLATVLGFAYHWQLTWRLRQSRGFAAKIAREGEQRRRAEEEARASQKLLQDYLDHTTGIAFIKEVDGRYTFVNRVWERLFNVQSSSVIGKRDDELWPAEYARIFVESDRLILASGRSELLVHQLPVSDGRVHHWLVAKFLLFDAHGRKRLGGFALDITERRRTEAALRDSEERFRKIYAHAPTGIAITDLEGRFLQCNPACCAILGRNERDLTQTAWTALLPEESLAEASDGTRRLLAERVSSFELDHPYLREGYPPSWLRTFVSLIRNDLGVPSNLVLLLTDITETKRAEEALRASEERFRELAEKIEDVFWVHDLKEPRLLYVSPAFERVWGRPVEMVLRDVEIWYEFLHPEDRERVRHAILTRQHTGSWEHEYRILRPDGQVRWVRDRAFPVRGERGEVTRIVGVARDVTERKRAEEGRLLLESQLRQAQKMEALGTLSAGIAHDFNNVLTAVIGNVELAAQDVGDNHPARVSIDEIRKAGLRARDLVQRLLAFSRPRELQPHALELGPITEEAVRLLRSTIPAGVEIVFGCEPNVPRINADPTEVHQIVMNLVTNAWHAIDRVGRIEIRIDRCEVGTDQAVALHPGTYVRLRVMDNGCGMDAATQGRIFDPFFTTKPPGQGTGLGLSVVHGIMRSQGGAVTVESTVGKGSTFALYFPPAPEMAGEAPEATAVEETVRAHGEHIMLLDDDAPLLYVLSRFLERLGYRVTAHSSATDALQDLRARPDAFHLVVTDFNMPGMSGLDVGREVRRIAPQIPVVLASGHLRPSEVEAARQSGISEIILKPDSVDVLARTLRRILSAATAPTPTPGEQI